MMAHSGDNDMLPHHSFNVEDLLKDDLVADSQFHSTSGLIGGRNIWSNPTSSSDGDFLHYNGLQNGGQSWPSYSDAFTSSSPSKEAPTSSPESDAGSDYSWRCDSGVNGIDFSRWNGITNGIYDPFKSNSVIDDLDPMHAKSREKSPLRRSQSANSRPTFADVAKKPSSPGSEPPPTPSLSNDDPVYGSQESLTSLLDKKVKPKVFRPAHPRHGGYHVPLPINPDSKYGLDDFEVTDCGKMERSFSCNDALDRTPGDGQPTEESEESSEKKGSESAQGSEWFDPKRIFMNGRTRGRAETAPADATILNNNAAARPEQGDKSNGRRGNTSYINNLHDSKVKVTNTDRVKPAMNGNGASHAPPDLSDDSDTPSAAGYYVSGSIRMAKDMLMELLRYLILALMFVFGVTSKGLYYVAHHTSVLVTTTFTYLAVKVGMNGTSHTTWNDGNFIKMSEKYGCEENIQLPNTCEEAMRRLLTCRGKDPYSILGLQYQASDEEIRRYYRRQAVLVHPDKNKQPGAEEAFKILGQAFDLIGSPEKRTVYDRKIEGEKWSEEMRMHTDDLLQKLKEKYDEASRWMQCSSCDKKHRRYRIERHVYSARKCNRCQCYHAAKEGEIWAETSFMGFKWHFYACMQNNIYDVTDWVVCQGLDNRIQPNAHSVNVKISSTSPASSSSGFGLRDPANYENLESLLKSMFPQQTSGPTEKAAPADGHPKSSQHVNKKSKRRSKRR